MFCYLLGAGKCKPMKSAYIQKQYNGYDRVVLYIYHFGWYLIDVFHNTGICMKWNRGKPSGKRVNCFVFYAGQYIVVEDIHLIYYCDLSSIDIYSKLFLNDKNIRMLQSISINDKLYVGQIKSIEYFVKRNNLMDILVSYIPLGYDTDEIVLSVINGEGDMIIENIRYDLYFLIKKLYSMGCGIKSYIKTIKLIDDKLKSEKTMIKGIKIKYIISVKVDINEIQKI